MTRRDDFSLALRYAAPPPMTPNQDELDPLAIVRLIRRRFWLIVGISSLMVALAFPLILGMKKIYYAESRLLIQNQLTAALASSAEDKQLQLNLTTEVERLRSRDVAVQVIRELGIDKRPEFNPALREESWLDHARAALRQFLSAGPTETSGSLADDIDWIAPTYLDALTVLRERKFEDVGVLEETMSDVVRIGFASEDPQLAAAVPSALLRTYLAERETSVARDTQRAKDWLNARIYEQTARAEAAIATFEGFGGASGIAFGDALSRASQLVSTLDTTRMEIERERFALSATLTSLDAASSQSEMIALIESESIVDIDNKLILNRNDYDRLVRLYGENHDEVKIAFAALSSAEEQLKSSIDRSVHYLQANLRNLDNEEAKLGLQLTSAMDALSRLDIAMVKRDRLRRIADAERSILENLQEQERVLEAESKLQIANVEVLSPATPPLAPIGRGRLFYLMAVSFAAGLIGLTVATALEFIDRSVRSFQQLQGISGLTGAAMVPVVSRRIAGSLHDLIDRGHEGRFGEALRGLVLALRQANGGRMPTSLLVTSPLPGEGKSLVAAALAVEVGASGQRVLLVDGDSAHGRVHRLFEGRESPGLAEYLRGEAGLEDVMRHDDASGVDYIARGLRTPGRPRESDRLGALVEAAKDSGRLLIFDSAPVFASVETTRLAMAVGRTILVVRWGRTRRAAVKSAMLQLRSGNSAEMLGVINMVDLRRHGLYGFNESESYSSALRHYETSYS